MKKNKIQLIETWDKAALNFGQVGPKYWDEFGQKLVELADIKEGNIVLDMGMGRGAALFPAAKKVGNNGKVIGIDISEVMVRATEESITQSGINNIEVIQMDAEELRFSSEYFNNIVSGFCIGNILGQDKKLKGLRRFEFKRHKNLRRKS